MRRSPNPHGEDVVITHTSTTDDGKPVFSGVFRFYETHGLPLDVVCDLIKQRGGYVDWLDFYLDARKAGMKHDRIISKIDESISDSFGQEVRDHVIRRLDVLGRHITPVSKT